MKGAIHHGNAIAADTGDIGPMPIWTGPAPVRQAL